MIHHTRAVSRGTERALVVADMPFLTYQVSAAEAVGMPAGCMQEGGAAAVKLEGGRPVIDVVQATGGRRHSGDGPPRPAAAVGAPAWRLRRQATRPDEADELIDDALALEEAGRLRDRARVDARRVARAATAHVTIPTIGIGAGPDCDGQILVSHDMLGLFDGFVPPFVKQYAHLADTIVAAGRAYVDDVRAGAVSRSRTRTIAGTRHDLT